MMSNNHITDKHELSNKAESVLYLHINHINGNKKADRVLMLKLRKGKVFLENDLTQLHQ